MSFKRDSLLIVLYAAIIAAIVAMTNHVIPPALAGPLAFVVNFYLGLYGLLASMQNGMCLTGALGCALGIIVVFLAAYVLLFVLYLVSWAMTEIGRLFIQSWGASGGPGVGFALTVVYCLPSIFFYLVAWWLCPVNHRPITNLVYSLHLMRLWPLTVLLIVLVGLIPGAALSNHYRDVCRKVIDNYPYG